MSGAMLILSIFGLFASACGVALACKSLFLARHELEEEETEEVLSDIASMSIWTLLGLVAACLCQMIRSFLWF